MIDKVIVTKDNRSPSVFDTIMVDDAILDLTGSTVKFRMRKIGTSTLKVDAAASLVNSPGTDGQVKYDWAAADVDTQGEYRAWWHVTLASTETLDTPEFPVIVDAHTDGQGATEGEISYQAKQFMAVTWDALSNDERFGDRMLQSRVSYVKFKLFGTIADPLAEATIYNPMLLDYMAKEVALQIIPAGIDYWMEQQTSVVTSGTNETVSYPDRINALEKLQDWLVGEVRSLRPEFEGQFTVRRKGRTPKVGNTDQDVVTADPNATLPAYDRQGGLPLLPWGPDLPWGF